MEIVLNNSTETYKKIAECYKQHGVIRVIIKDEEFYFDIKTPKQLKKFFKVLAGLLTTHDETIDYKDYKNYKENTGKICFKIDNSFDNLRKTIKVKVPVVIDIDESLHKYHIQHFAYYGDNYIKIDYNICGIDEYILTRDKDIFIRTDKYSPRVYDKLSNKLKTYIEYMCKN